MTTRRTFLSTTTGAALAAAFMLAALVPAGAHAQTVMKAADAHPAGYSTVVAVENMGKKIEAETNGRIKFQMFPGGVLGGEKEMIEQTQIGAIHILRTSLGPVGTVVPEVNVFNMPFVFRDEAHLHAVLDGEIGQEMLDKISDSSARMVALAFTVAGSRNLYTKKPVRAPDDLKGQKIRVMGNPLFIDTMNAMGGNGISMGYGEVFSALQTGVIDGAENNEPSLFTSNHYTTGTKYYTQTRHLMIPEIIAMSKVAWNRLSPEDQALFKRLGREAQMEQRALWAESVADSTAKLKAAGVEFIEIDAKPFYEATAPVREKYGAQHAELIKRIQAVGNGG
ncbi:MAG: TRAP transporter substrate-binding protein [Rhodocyclaceae bacterium]